MGWIFVQLSDIKPKYLSLPRDKLNRSERVAISVTLNQRFGVKNLFTVIRNMSTQIGSQDRVEKAVANQKAETLAASLK